MMSGVGNDLICRVYTTSAYRYCLSVSRSVLVSSPFAEKIVLCIFNYILSPNFLLL